MCYSQLGCPVQLMHGGTTSNWAGTMPSQYFAVGESSPAHETGTHHRHQWEVDCYLKNSGRLFYGGIDPKVAVEWFDTAYGVLQHMDCHLRSG